MLDFFIASNAWNLGYSLAALHVASGPAPPKNNMTMENQPFEDVWILLKMVIFQPAMLVYQRVLGGVPLRLP